MAQPSKWHSLPALPNLPPLLVSFAFTKSSYALHVTDLANIWVEELDRRGILLRSLQQNTSIDLSDADPEQWTVFLSKLNAAFDPTSPDHHLTSLALAPDSNDALALCITCILPKPLEPLRWPVQLTKCPSTTLASELVLPLIQAHHLRHQEAQDLMAQLREKDVVINKFIDKLAATRTGLEHIFTSLSAKQRVSREAANKKIKGLAPFDEAKWREEREHKESQDPEDLLQDVFGTSGVAYQRQTDLAKVSDRPDDWWKSFKKALSTPAESKDDTPRKASQRPVEVAQEQPKDEDEDEDFQVQATPPHLQARLASRGTRHKEPEGDETESDDDSDEAIPDSHPIQPQPETRQKIGALGKRKATTQTQSASTQSSKTIPAEDDNATASDSEDDEKSSPPKAVPSHRMGVIGKTRRSPGPSAKAASLARPPVDAGDDSASGPSSDGRSDSDRNSDSGSQSPIVKPKPTAVPRKGGLGRIGGKFRPRPSPDAPREQTPTSDKKGGEVEAPKRPETRKIGAIGTKRSNAASSSQPKEPETEEQRAERKRAQLASELEQKSKAPAKKKRKF
ncbi:XLF-domain-containing protein [Xylariaceae sp. FL1019]|nr:XLF-domain-containing protein [Xylariaceae sp. FL1019]